MSQPATLSTKKNSIERNHDKIRQRFTLAFAADQKIGVLHDPGSFQSDYVKNGDGAFENHSNGVRRRFSCLMARGGRIIKSTEAIDLTSYTVEIHSILGHCQSSYVFSREELEKLLEDHLINADFDKAREHFASLVKSMSREQAALDYMMLRTKLSMSPEPELIEKTQLSLLQHHLSNLLPSLVDEAFEENGKTGRLLYLSILKQAYQNNHISGPLYWLSYLCVRSGFTFIWRVKELTLEQLDISQAPSPLQKEYKQWLNATCDISCKLINQMRKDTGDNLFGNSKNLPGILKIQKKKEAP